MSILGAPLHMWCLLYPVKEFLFRNAHLPGSYSVVLFLILPPATAHAQTVNLFSPEYLVHTCIAPSSQRFNDLLNLPASPFRVWAHELGRDTGHIHLGILSP